MTEFTYQYSKFSDGLFKYIDICKLLIFFRCSSTWEWLITNVYWARPLMLWASKVAIPASSWSPWSGSIYVFSIIFFLKCIFHCFFLGFTVFYIAHTKNSSLVTSSCAGMFLCMLEWLSSQVCFMMTCSLITAIQLELLNDPTTQEFVKSFSNKSQPEGSGLKKHALRMEGNLLLLQDGFEAVISRMRACTLPIPSLHLMAVKTWQGPLVGWSIQKSGRTCETHPVHANQTSRANLTWTKLKKFFWRSTLDKIIN